MSLSSRRFSTEHSCLTKQSSYRIPCLFGKIDVDNPDPPESLPAYITDGVPKQDTESLRELQDWIDQLIQYRNNLSGDEIGADVDQDEKIEQINNSGDTTTVIKKVPCGKDACSNCPHGPYRYEVYRQRGKLVWDYHGSVDN